MSSRARADWRAARASGSARCSSTAVWLSLCRASWRAESRRAPAANAKSAAKAGSSRPFRRPFSSTAPLTSNAQSSAAWALRERRAKKRMRTRAGTRLVAQAFHAGPVAMPKPQ